MTCEGYRKVELVSVIATFIALFVAALVFEKWLTPTPPDPVLGVMIATASLIYVFGGTAFVAIILRKIRRRRFGL